MAELNENEPLIRRDNQEESVDLDNRDPKKINEDVAKVQMIDFIIVIINTFSIQEEHTEVNSFVLSALQLLLHLLLKLFFKNNFLRTARSGC